MDSRADLSDAVWTLNFLFRGFGYLACPDAADINDDSTINIGDPIYGLNYLFLNGPPPRSPYPDSGVDPTPEAPSPRRM